jgi:malate-CoA ligase subunit beta
MDVHEYQAKELLANFGVTIPRGAVAFSPDQAVYAATQLGGWHWAVKAQIHAGGRGKAGGIKLCRTYREVHEAARALLGKRLVTAQTGREGKPVQRIYVEVADPYEREFYLGYVLDRKVERVRVIASRHGGMDIEEIAKTDPEAILQVIVEPAVGMQAFQARELAFQLGLNIKQVARVVATIMGAYRAFRDCDATMLEINPLRDAILRISDDDEIAQRFREYRGRLASRLPIINQVNREQVELLRRFRTAQNEQAREEYKSALLLSINCIAAGLGITG